MTTRRQFMQSSFGLAALPLIIASAPHVAAARGTRLQTERFVFDDRFAEAVVLGRVASRSGITADEISGDLGELWYDHLDPMWRRAPNVVAGATTWRGLFVLRTLAADRGMWVAYSGEHRVQSNGYVRHRLSGPRDLITSLSSGSVEAFWERLGDAITQRVDGKHTTVNVELNAPVTAAVMRNEPLFTWILAPRNRCGVDVRVGAPT